MFMSFNLDSPAKTVVRLRCEDNLYPRFSEDRPGALWLKAPRTAPALAVSQLWPGSPIGIGEAPLPADNAIITHVSSVCKRENRRIISFGSMHKMCFGEAVYRCRISQHLVTTCNFSLFVKPKRRICTKYGTDPYGALIPCVVIRTYLRLTNLYRVYIYYIYKLKAKIRDNVT